MSANIWKGQISFGLLNIGVTLQSAQEDKSISFSMLDGQDLAPIHYKKINGRTGKEVPYKRIVKGYELQKGRFVIVNDADFKAANPKATQTLDIEDFVKTEDVDPMMFDRPYYVVPQPKNEKSYTLLRDVLKKTGSAAVGRLVIHTKQHLALLMAKGDYLILEELRFSHEVKNADDVNYLDKAAAKPKYTAKEMTMAMNLVKGMTAAWNPDKYKDTYYNDLMSIIHKKAKEGKKYSAPKESGKEAAASSNVVDLLPLLRKSLQAKEPAKKKARKSHLTSVHA